MNRTLWLIALIVVIVGVFFYFDQRSLNNKVDRPDAPESNPTPVQNDEIIVSTPLPGDVVTSPLRVSGEARGSWYFEATFPVELVDENGNTLFRSFLEAQGEWMTPDFVPFDKTFTFEAAAGTRTRLILHKANASGLPEHDDSVVVNVTIGESSGNQADTTNLQVFFASGGNDCEGTESVERAVPQTRAVAHAALTELLEGPTDSDASQGLSSGIPQGTRLNSVRIHEGVAYADFSEELNQAAGSCLVTSIRSQIEDTLFQFNTVGDVVISVNGDSDTALQP